MSSELEIYRLVGMSLCGVVHRAPHRRESVKVYSTLSKRAVVNLRARPKMLHICTSLPGAGHLPGNYRTRRAFLRVAYLAGAEQSRAD